MAEAKQETNRELDELAFRIFAQRVAVSPRRGGEQDAIGAYRDAGVFLAVRGKIRDGSFDAKPATGPVLADCFAPNLKTTHPHNLVSADRGDLTTVNRIQKFLNANPTPERNPLELVERFNRDFRGFEWDLPTINVARAIFPAYCSN